MPTRRKGYAGPTLPSAILYLLRFGRLPKRSEEPEHCSRLLLAWQRRRVVGALEEDWRTVREELLAEWIAENPGTRPAAWWQFDSPEKPRLWLADDGSAMSESEATVLQRHRLFAAGERRRLPVDAFEPTVDVAAVDDEGSDAA